VPKSKRKIYLDYASSSLKKAANPSAIHELGVAEKGKLESARARVARVLHAHPEEIVFTSGATESNNIVILGSPKGHVVTTNIEHASVLEPVKHRGSATFVPVEANGIVDPKKIRAALRPDTILVSVIYANNEIGTIQPIQEISKVIRHHRKTHGKKVYFHTDATQAINYLPIDVEKLGVDLLTFNGAKIYGPKSAGVLYVKRNTPLMPTMFGGEQERGLRPGTENPDVALELARALENAEKNKIKEIKRLKLIQKYFFDSLARINKKIIINGDIEDRLPNNINITVPNIPSDLLVIELSAHGVMASAKSACKAGDGKASHVISAINPKIKETDGSLRFSLGRETSRDDVSYALSALKNIFDKLEKWYN
jgi:cysteine desulfurase